MEFREWTLIIIRIGICTNVVIIPIVRAYKLVMGTLCPQNVMYVIQYRARLCMEKKRSG